MFDYEEQKFPLVSQEFLDALMRAFPIRTPDMDDSDREIGAQIGEQRVIEFLLGVLNEQLQPKE